MKKNLSLIIFSICLFLPLFAYAHPGHHHQVDRNGHVIQPDTVAMTPAQQALYKKTVAATLDFLEKFRTSDKPTHRQWLDQLKNELIFSYDHPYRTRGFCNAFALCRDDYVGMKLSAMNSAQQDKFFELMQTLLAPYGYQKMEKVFARQRVIFDMEQAHRDNPEKFPAAGGPAGTALQNWQPVDANGNPIGRDSDDYYIAFFGDLESFINGALLPGQGFGIRIEGHHLSLNFTFVNKDQRLALSSSPTFSGSNPMVVPPAPDSSPDKYKNWKLKVGDTFMLSETQLAKLLIKSLNPEEQKIARYSHMGSPMFEMAAEQKPLESASYEKGNHTGLFIAELQKRGTESEIEQKKYLLLELLKLIAATQRTAFLNLADLSEDMNNMRISYYGKLDTFDEFYFRIQSKQFLFELVQSHHFSVINPGDVRNEHDPLNNGLYNNNHVHIMFRDLRNDWGYDPLALHTKQDHQSN